MPGAAERNSGKEYVVSANVGARLYEPQHARTSEHDEQLRAAWIGGSAAGHPPSLGFGVASRPALSRRQ